MVLNLVLPSHYYLFLSFCYCYVATVYCYCYVFTETVPAVFHQHTVNLCSTRPLLLLYNTLLLLCLQHFSTLLLQCPCITLLLLSLQCTVADVSVQYAVLNCYVVCCYCCFSTVYITVSWDLLFACLLASCTSFFAASKHTVCNWSLQSVWKRLWLYS